MSDQTPSLDSLPDMTRAQYEVVRDMTPEKLRIIMAMSKVEMAATSIEELKMLKEMTAEDMENYREYFVGRPSAREWVRGRTRVNAFSASRFGRLVMFVLGFFALWIGLEIIRWLWSERTFTWTFTDAIFLLMTLILRNLLSRVWPTNTSNRFVSSISWLTSHYTEMIQIMYFVVRWNDRTPTGWQSIIVAVDFAPIAGAIFAATSHLIFRILLPVVLGVLVLVAGLFHANRNRVPDKETEKAAFDTGMSLGIAIRPFLDLFSIYFVLLALPILIALFTSTRDILRLTVLISVATSFFSSIGLSVSWAKIGTAILAIGGLFQTFMAGVDFYDRFISPRKQKQSENIPNPPSTPGS